MTEPNDSMSDSADDYIWRVTKKADGVVSIEPGPRLEGFVPDSYLPLVGRALISIGTNLQRATVNDEDEDDMDYNDE